MISALSYREILVNNSNNNYCNNSENGVKSDLKLAVDVKNVVFLYKKNITVLNNICVQIPEGKIYALLGSNGCGKTTLLRIVLGRLKPKSGYVRVFGKEPNSRGSNIPGPGVGYMPQEIALFYEFTIKDILCYFGKLYNMELDLIQQRIEHLIELLNLPEKNRKVGQLSGGQQRLVSIAVTMIHRPPLLILDEPTVGVDSLLRCQIWKYLDHICKNEGKTVIITTHYIEEARTASTVAFMRSGVLLTQTNPNLLLIEHNCKTLEEVFLKLCQRNKEEAKTSGAVIKTTIIDKTHEQIYEKYSSTTTNTSKVIDWNRMKALLMKNYLRVRRNPLILVLFHLIPIMQIFLLIVSSSKQPHNLPVSIYNAELKPNLSQLYIDQIDKKKLHITYHKTNESAFDSVVRGKSWYAITFAQNFSDSFRNRFLEPVDVTDEDLESSKIKLYADMSNSLVGIHIEIYLQYFFHDFLHNYSSSLGFNPIAFSLPVNFEDPIYGKKEPLFYETLAPGMIMGTLHALPMILGGIMLVLERSEGHLERAFVAGVKPIEVLLAHILLIFIAIISSVLVSMFTAFIIFDIPLKGLVIDVFALLVLQGFQGMNFGLFLAIILFDIVFVGASMTSILMPLWMCSGLLWPIESVPDTLRMLFYFNPLTLPIESLRSVMLRGWGINNPNIIIGYVSSIAYSSIVFIINIIIFNKFSSSTIF